MYNFLFICKITKNLLNSSSFHSFFYFSDDEKSFTEAII